MRPQRQSRLRVTAGQVESRARFALALGCVAFGAGLFSVAFRTGLQLVYGHLYRADNVLAAISSLPWWLRLIVPTLGGLAAGLFTRHITSRPQGVSNVMEAVALGNVRLSIRATLCRAAGSWCAIAAGMSIGREGPLIEFGGSLGGRLSRALSMPLDRTRALVAAGTAAGFAAAYNTPFAAVLFVVETIAGIASPDALLPTMAATVIATALTRAVAGGGPIYGSRAFTLTAPVELVAYVLLGGVAVAVALVFKATLSLGERIADRYPVPWPWRPALGGLFVGVVAALVAGNGYEPLNLVLEASLGLRVMTVLLMAKIIATSFSVASGVPGGIFTPVLLAGGLTGALFAHVLQAAGIAAAGSQGSYALVGMAATTAATIHAPLTAAVMVFELSGDYPIVLPLMVATAVATSLSRWLRSESIYAAELRRRGLGWKVTLDGRELAE